MCPHPRTTTSSARGSAAASFYSPFGLIRSAWAVDGTGAGQLNVTVPPNTRAAIYVPTSAAAQQAVRVHDVGSGRYSFDWG